MGESNIEFGIEMAKTLVFSREVEKIGGFIIVCKLYLRMKMKGVTIEKQVQWILPYV